MPSRIIRPGIIDSDRVNALDWPAEVFYRRLLSVVDDHGLYDARPSKLRADLYPLKLDTVREADVTRWIAACVKANLVVLYFVPANAERSTQDGLRPANASTYPQDRDDESNPIKWFLKVLDTRWQIRSEPKYPAPPANLKAPDNGCAQLRTRTEAHSYSLSETEEPATAEGPDPANALAKATGMGLAMNPEIRGLMRSLIAIDGFEHARSALDKSIGKKGPGKKAVQYAAGIIRGELEERKVNGSPAPTKSLKDRPKVTKNAS